MTAPNRSKKQPPDDFWSAALTIRRQEEIDFYRRGLERAETAMAKWKDEWIEAAMAARVKGK